MALNLNFSICCMCSFFLLFIEIISVHLPKIKHNMVQYKHLWPQVRAVDMEHMEPVCTNVY